MTIDLTSSSLDYAFTELGLSTDGVAALLPTLDAAPDWPTAIQEIVSLPQVQAQDVRVMQMFDAAIGHVPTFETLGSVVSSNLTALQLATDLVSSQAFANLYNGGALMDPNAPVSHDPVTALFINALGHAPTPATLAGFDGMTNEQAFLAFAASDTVTGRSRRSSRPASRTLCIC
jgi:hypothetical protein